MLSSVSSVVCILYVTQFPCYLARYEVGKICSFFLLFSSFSFFFVNGMCKYMYISRYEIKCALMVVFCKITKNHLEALSSVCRRKLLTIIKLYFVTCVIFHQGIFPRKPLISGVTTSSHIHSVLYHQYHLML